MSIGEASDLFALIEAAACKACRLQGYRIQGSRLGGGTSSKLPPFPDMIAQIRAAIQPRMVQPRDGVQPSSRSTRVMATRCGLPMLQANSAGNTYMPAATMKATISNATKPLRLSAIQ